ncbi:MAG: ATP-binding protein [Chitinivorax sp.]
MNENIHQNQEIPAGAGKAAAEANPMRKIILMVGVAIALFLAFTAYSVHKSIQSSAQLSEIRDLYFPVLERVDANIVRLDKMEERYLQAAMIGEKDMVGEADEFYGQADKIFGEMDKLYPERARDIAKLRDDFKQYKTLASTTSLAMISKKESVGPDASVRMNKALTALKQQIKDFRKSSYDNFVSTLLESQRTTKVNLYLGMIIGAMNLVFMGVLVFFIRNTVRMTAVIAEQNATLELRVAERTAQLSQKTNDINAMLNNMSLGVCTVVPGNKLHPEYSAYMKTIFETDDLAGKDVLEVLFANSTLGVDSKDQVAVALGAIVGEDAMMFDFNSHLLVGEMQLKGRDGHNKILQMNWSPIKNDADMVDKVLLIVQDVTHLRELELAAAHQKEELDLISQIIKISIGKFNDFIDSANKFIVENRELIESKQSIDPEVIAALFRNMHTIKGNARTYEFKLVTDAAHAAEQHYDHLRKDAEAIWDQSTLLQELDAVAAAIARYVEINEDKLGRKGRASDLLTTRGTFVGSEEIASIRAMVADLAQRGEGTDINALQKAVNHLGLIPLQRLISGAVDSLSSLAKELNKPTPAVDIVNGDVAFNNTFAEALKISLMHIVRNSLDHGIESPQDRAAAGKAEQGQVRFACERNGDALELHISDDGRGLALHKLYEKGVANGVFNGVERPSPEAVAELIFQSGLSTAAQVTQVSGRGVGMDAVRTFLEKEGGSIRIVLSKPGAEFGFTPFKFVLSLPATAFSS